MFDELVQELGTPMLMELLGRAMIYVSGDGTQTTVGGFSEATRSAEQEDTQGGRQIKIHDIFTISTDPASEHGGIPDPKNNAQLIDRGATWAIRQIMAKTPNYAVLDVQRVGQIERSRPALRPRR